MGRLYYACGPDTEGINNQALRKEMQTSEILYHDCGRIKARIMTEDNHSSTPTKSNNVDNL